jgi:hypothetical protein
MSELDPDDLRRRLAAVGEHLLAMGETCSIVIVGGAALGLGGHLVRTTEDVDVYACASRSSASARLSSARPLPAPLAKAAAVVARDFDMPTDWLNSLVSPDRFSDPPPQLEQELRWLRFDGLEVGVAGRRALLALKLHAAADRDERSVHFQDLRAMHPTDEELGVAAKWVVRQDIGPDFPPVVEAVIARLRRLRDGRG